MLDDFDDGKRDRPLFELMLRACRCHRRIVERRFSQLGIHGGQHHMLMRLSHVDGAITQSELARSMDISGATTANMLKRLESGGYISRTAHQDDGRCNMVSLTPKGWDVVEESRHIFETLEMNMFQGFTRSDADTLRRLLTTINNNLTRMEEEADGSQATGKE